MVLISFVSVRVGAQCILTAFLITTQTWISEWKCCLRPYFRLSVSVSTLRLWTRLPFTSWAVWPDDDENHSPAVTPCLQTETRQHKPTANIIRSQQRANPETPVCQETTVPQWQSANGRWTPSCCSPNSTECSTRRCIRAKTTGGWAFLLRVTWSYLFSSV